MVIFTVCVDFNGGTFSTVLCQNTKHVFPASRLILGQKATQKLSLQYEPRKKKNSYFPLYCLFNRGHRNGLS